MRRPSPRAALAVATGLLLGLVAGVGGTQGAFSSVTGNTGNTFSAAPAFACAGGGGGGTQNIIADYDAEVHSSNVNANYGTLNSLDVRSDAGDLRRAFVHFPLPAAPAGCVVTSATLTFVVRNSDGHALNALRVAAAWTELGITWANQPATAGAPSSATSAPGMTFSVGPQVQAMYLGGTDFGFVVVDTQEGLVGGTTTFVSLNDANGGKAPQLTITFG